MSLSSLHLDAFLAAARARNFSRAAKALFITQSALTQRIGNFEAELGTALFIRKPRGVELTEAGRRVLRYCQAREQLEGDLVAGLGGSKDGALGGAIRVGGFSSVVRSVLLPALSPLVREHPSLQLHLQNVEMGELPGLLASGEVDFVVLDHALSRADVESIALGEEENVLVVSSRAAPPDVYLDHDPDDSTTARFLRAQSKTVPPIARAYLDEIYAILDGAAAGLGKAVVPRHLVTGDDRLQVVPGLEPMRSPVVLHWVRQPFYTVLHHAVVDALSTRSGALLAPKPAKGGG